jgi:hypothetical protein
VERVEVVQISEDLLDSNSRAMGRMIRFETSLRERIISVLGSEVAWWKRRIPEEVRSNAEKRRSKDRESPFAPSFKYHQIYYCYLDDLRSVVVSRLNRASFSIDSDRDLVPRFDELVALRNRLAHGRLLVRRIKPARWCE